MTNECPQQMSHKLQGGGVGEMAVSGVRVVERQAGLSPHTGDKWSGGRRPLKFLLAVSRPRPRLAATHSAPETAQGHLMGTGVRGRASQQGARHSPGPRVGTGPLPCRSNPPSKPSPSSRKQEGRGQAMPTFGLLPRLAMPCGSCGCCTHNSQKPLPTL